MRRFLCRLGWHSWKMVALRRVWPTAKEFGLFICVYCHKYTRVAVDEE